MLLITQTREKAKSIQKTTSRRNAPINVNKLAVRVEGRGKRGMGWGFHIFQKFGIKFPTHRQIIPVKSNQISPPRAAPCCQITHGWTQRDNNNISVQIKLYNRFLKMLLHHQRYIFLLQLYVLTIRSVLHCVEYRNL